MQEVSIMVAYDAHVVDRPGEEDTLARLVAHSRPLRAPRPVVGLFCLSLSFVSFLLSSLLLMGDIQEEFTCFCLFFFSCDLAFFQLFFRYYFLVFILFYLFFIRAVLMNISTMIENEAITESTCFLPCGR